MTNVNRTPVSLKGLQVLNQRPSLQNQEETTESNILATAILLNGKILPNQSK
jgi:hypothetical protein